MSQEANNIASAAPSSHLLSVVFSQRQSDAERLGDWSDKLTADYQNWLGLFIELQGDRPILDYTKADARAFRDAILSLPSNRSKLPETEGLSARDAIKVAKEQHLATISRSTIDKGIGRLQAIWKWAATLLDDEVSDIFGPMKLGKKGRAQDDKDPFSAAQLQTIFDGPIYTGCRSKRFRTEPGTTVISDTSWYWLPLLGLWTGARLNELCQLRLNDICMEDDIWFLRIHAEGETQRVKGGKKRIVPIHPELHRLGFLRFTEAQRQAGHDRVFPDLILGPTGYYSDRSSKDFSNYITKIGAKTDKTSFHSFRHNFKDACRIAGVPPDINDALLGHSLPGMAGRYGKGVVLLETLFEAICKVGHKGLT